MSKLMEQTSYKTDQGNAPQQLTITSTGPVLSTVLSAQAGVVRLAADVACWITSGSSTVTASSTVGGGSIFLPGSLVEYKNFDRGDFISVIADGSPGFLSFSEETQ